MEINGFEITWTHLAESIIIIAFGLALCAVVKKFKLRLCEKIEDDDDGLKRKSIISAITKFLNAFILFFSVLSVFQINGLKVSSILTGLGIVSAVAVVASKDIASDFAQGVRISFQRMYKTGDYILFNGSANQVIEFTMVSTKLKELGTDNITLVSNSEIRKVTQLSGKEIIFTNLPYDLSPQDSEKFMRDCEEKILEIEGVNSCKYLGVKELGDSYVTHAIRFSCHPGSSRLIKGKINMLFLKMMTDKGIPIPHAQIEVVETGKED